MPKHSWQHKPSTPASRWGTGGGGNTHTLAVSVPDTDSAFNRMMLSSNLCFVALLVRATLCNTCATLCDTSQSLCHVDLACFLRPLPQSHTLANTSSSARLFGVFASCFVLCRARPLCLSLWTWWRQVQQEHPPLVQVMVALRW